MLKRFVGFLGFVSLVTCSLISARANAATVDFTGTWSGTISGQSSCPGGGTVTQSLDVLGSFIQSGGVVNGAFSATGPQDHCIPGSPTAVLFVIPIGSTVSGNTLTLSDNRGTITASVSGTTMSFLLTFINDLTSKPESLSGTLKQTSSQVPSSTLNGTYTGTYTYTFDDRQFVTPQHPGCVNPAIHTFTSSGNGTITVLQFGALATISASFPNVQKVIDDGHGNCRIGPEDDGGVLSGTVNGNVISFEDRSTLTVNGNTLATGGGPASSNSIVFNGTRTSTSIPPIVASFTASKSTIDPGESTTLSWSVLGATSLSIDNGVGAQPLSGSVTVSPARTTTYTLTATGASGSTTAALTVTVVSGGPNVVLGTLPQGMLQLAGVGGGTDTFTLVNTGTVAANVSITPSGTFFSVDKSSVTLAPGQAQTIVLTGTAQPANSYSGSVDIAGDGISQTLSARVRLLVASRPTAPVDPQPTAPRVELDNPAGQNPSGSASFVNGGTGVVQAIAVADVPWILPTPAIITIQPGQTQGVSFDIDRSKRPDAAALSGAAFGSLSLRFLTAASPKTGHPLDTTPAGSTVSVTIVEVVKPAVTAGTPPALQTGEVAMFLTGLGTAPPVFGDAFFASRAGATISDLKFFLTPGGQSAALPSLNPNATIAFPALSKSVFGVEGGPTIQIRGSLLNAVSVSAVRLVNPSGATAFTSSFPVFRSDRGVIAGDRLVLSGVEKKATSGTVVIVQEVSGNAGSAELQAYDRSGAPVGAPVTLSLTAFGQLTDSGGTVTDNVASVRVKNTSTGSARINAFARVQDTGTNDLWMVVDPQRVAAVTSDTLIMPIVPSPPSSAVTTLYVTNTSASPVDVHADVAGVAPPRRRAITHSIGPESTSTIRSLETTSMTFSNTSGYVRITPGASVSAAGRITMKQPSGSSFGGALPVVPLSSALASSDSRRFAGVDDASAASVSGKKPGTSRTSLLLVETAGQPAVVRVTLRYTLLTSLTSSQSVSKREFNVAAGQTKVIADLAAEVIGSARASYGDLRNMQVDVDVISGDGRVLPFIESVDNNTGDITVRAE